MRTFTVAIRIGWVKLFGSRDLHTGELHYDGRVFPEWPDHIIYAGKVWDLMEHDSLDLEPTPARFDREDADYALSGISPDELRADQKAKELA